MAGRTVLDIDGVRFELHPMGPAQTPEDLTIFLPDRGVAFVGDIVFRNRIPYVGQADSAHWIASLKTLLQLPIRVLVPGHGPLSTQPREDMTLTRDYLIFLRDAMRKAARDMEPFDAAYAATDWSRFERLPLFKRCQPHKCLQHLSAHGAGGAMRPDRRLCMLALCGLPSWAPAQPGRALSPDLPSPESLPQSLAQALARREPLLLMASLTGCPFCHVVRRQHLWPLVLAGGAVVQISFKEGRSLRDWQGRTLTQAQMVAQLGITVAPTLLFFGPGTQEVALRLEGASIPDFYGAYLDDRLAQARAAVRG